MPILRKRRAVLLALGALASVAAGWLWVASRGTGGGAGLPPGDYTPRPLRDWEVEPARAEAIREAALARARVWRAPAVPVERADLTRNPGDGDPLDLSRPLACKFLPSAIRGTTPKFDCVLRGGEVVKVKYGDTPEIPAEIAASRLLRALGFGGDRMYMVPVVRCYGCPASPFEVYRVLDLTRMDEAYSQRIDYGRYTDFTWVAVERRFRGATIASGEVKGWSFQELAKIDPARGGSGRAEVDALRLLAAFLAHWDNKSENQRLACLDDPGPGPRGDCARPHAYIQDLGSTFGPNKADFANWSARSAFTDRPRCEVGMKDLPFEGATFGTAVISEPGRRFLGDRLVRLGEKQLHDLFAGARVSEIAARGVPRATVPEWVAAFRKKVAEIVDGPPCPG